MASAPTLEELRDLPVPVRSWRVEEGVDAADEPAVWARALLEGDDVDPVTLHYLKAAAREAVRRATGLWAYVLVRDDDTDAAA